MAPLRTSPSVVSEKEVRRQVEALGPWFHNLHLPGGVETAPDHFLGDFPRYKWEQLAPHLPRDLSGWSALDIGCNGGYYTFELCLRGASVTGLDVDEHYLAQAHWAAEHLGLAERVRFRHMQVYDLAGGDERFDLVLFMGLFYHLRYPLLALDLVAERVGRLMIFQTLTMPGTEAVEPPENLLLDEREAMRAEGWPKMAFIEHRLAGDPTNWWAPNHAAVEAMLRSSGMRVCARPGHEIYVCEPDPDHPAYAADWGRKELAAATGRSGQRSLRP